MTFHSPGNWEITGGELQGRRNFFTETDGIEGDPLGTVWAFMRTREGKGKGKGRGWGLEELEDLLREFPDLKREDIQACFEFAAQSAQETAGITPRKEGMAVW